VELGYYKTGEITAFLLNHI